MDVMRVDNPEHGKHDHGFGLGAHDPEPHEVSPVSEPQGHEAESQHGLFDSIGHGAGASLGGHVEVGHLSADFGHDGLHEGLDGLHDSVHHSIGLGFEGDHHHSLHEGLHEGLHDSLHADLHDTQHDLGHGLAHDPQHDVHHNDTGLGDLFHH
jgi:hypothetical protein